MLRVRVRDNNNNNNNNNNDNNNNQHHQQRKWPYPFCISTVCCSDRKEFYMFRVCDRKQGKWRIASRKPDCLHPALLWSQSSLGKFRIAEDITS